MQTLATMVRLVSLATSSASTTAEPVRISRRVSTRRLVIIRNELFSPTQEQFDHAYDILEAYRVATEDEHKGSVMFGDEMIDEASRKMATKFVRRGERAGLSRSR